MALESAPHTAAVSKADHSSYVDWPAIFAGAVVAAAISVVLLAFGSAIGLTLTNPFGREGVSLFWIAIAMAIWVVWVQVSALMIGGYLTGRMRRRNHDATEHESDIRDGFHGLLVWGTAVLISGILAFSGVQSVVQGAGSAIGGASAVAADQLDEANPFAASADTLLRGADAEAVDRTAEVGRILSAGVTGEGVTDADRTYLAGLVAERTDLSQEEAEARVDEVIAQAQAVQDDIEAAAEQASRVGILVAFLTAASLAIGAAGAWFAAVTGGNHRDRQTVVPFFVRRDRPVA